MKAVVLAIPALLACGTAKTGIPYWQYTNSEFSTYVEHFEQLAKPTKGNDYKVTTTITLSATPLVDTDHTLPAGDVVLGECLCNVDGSRSIILSPDLVHGSPAVQESVIFHELDTANCSGPTSMAIRPTAPPPVL